MKKIALIFFTLVLCTACFTMTFAASSVVEKPLARLVLNGKSTVLKEKPILVSKKLYMTLKSLAVNMNIKDDKKSIVVNNAKKTYTLIKSKSKLVLTLNSKKANMNGKTVSLDSAPMLYKKVVYIPTDAVAKLFSYKVVWDEATGTIAICSNTSFNLVKSIFTKSDAAMNTAKYKGTMSIDINLGDIVTSKTQSSSETDGVNKLEHSLKSTDINGTIESEEKYTDSNFEYTKLSQNNIWTKTALEATNESVLASTNDNFVYSGLVVKTDANGNYVLEGDVELKGLFDDIYGDKTYKPHTKITLSKDQYLLNEVAWNSSGTTTISNQKLKYTFATSMTFAEYNGSFEVKIPDELLLVKETIKYDNDSSYISLNYPIDWEENRNIAGVEVAFISPLENGTDNFRENVILLVEDISSQPTTLEQYTSSILEQLPQTYTDFKLVSSEEATLGSIKAHKIIYTFTQGTYSVKIMQVWAVGNDNAYIITYTAKSDTFDIYIEYVDNIVKSFYVK